MLSKQMETLHPSIAFDNEPQGMKCTSIARISRQHLPVTQFQRPFIAVWLKLPSFEASILYDKMTIHGIAKHKLCR